MGKQDVIIVGAGIVGLTSAYHLKKENPDLSVKVIDRAGTYAQGNTAKSAAGFRNLFTAEINYKLSNSSIEFYRHIQDDLKFDLGMKFSGYLFLFTDRTPPWVPVMEERGIAEVLDIDDVFDSEVLRKSPDPETAGILGLGELKRALIGRNCGIIEPDLLSSFYYQELVKMGVEFSFSTEVRRIAMEPVNPLNYPGEPYIWQDKTVRSLDTSKGELQAETYIFATDVWTTGLLNPMGVDSHIRPKKRQVFQVSGDRIQKMLYSCKINSDGLFPFTIMPRAGVYLRPAPKEKSFWVGVADDVGRDFSFSEDPVAETDFYELNLKAVIDPYFPAFEKSKITGSWAGYYSYNTLDKAPYIFRFLNTIIATGTSGSGILKGDGIGKMVEGTYSSREYVRLYDGNELRTSSLGLERMGMEHEQVVL